MLSLPVLLLGSTNEPNSKASIRLQSCDNNVYGPREQLDRSARWLRFTAALCSSCSPDKYLSVPKLHHHILAAPAGRHLPASSTVNTVSRDHASHRRRVHGLWEESIPPKYP